jgi:hypothetical protein
LPFFNTGVAANTTTEPAIDFKARAPDGIGGRFRPCGRGRHSFFQNDKGLEAAGWHFCRNCPIDWEALQTN